MKQSLQLKIGQQLTMTPQLQQAIRLLQLSSLDLQQEIQEALDSNFMLEIDDNQNNQTDSNEENSYTDPTAADSNNSNDVASNSSKESPTENQAATPETPDLENVQVDFEEIQNTIPEELPTDATWDEVFENNTIHSTTGSTQLSGADSNFIDNLLQNNGKLDDNIQEHLTKQLDVISLSEQDRSIAEVVIDSVDDNGYLNASIDDLLENFPDQNDIEQEEIEAILHLIQSFDPPGVAARDLRENLLLQLKLLDSDTTWLNQARILVDRHLHLLGNREFTSLKRRMKLSEEDLVMVIKLIQSLNPRPASQISDQKPHYIVPDVIVKKYKGIWRAELNNDSIPPLTINKEYMELSKEVKNSTDASTMKENLQEAKWFIKSVQSRNETLLKVSRCILDFQQDFFNYGEEYMKALVLADVAEKVGMHESTISRVTTQKYMHTPKGIFELKYFFSSHVSTNSGGEASATAIRAVIKKIIDGEKTSKPYSDNKLSQILFEQNYKVARRTVAKYRESLSIPPSNERKTLV
ncbi:MAG: RNA polymerase factor sigma-54 [Pseudomonadota bacterium]